MFCTKCIWLFLCFWTHRCVAQYNVLGKQIKVNNGTHRINVAPSSVVLAGSGKAIDRNRIEFEFPELSGLAHDLVIYIAWEAYGHDGGPSCVYYTKLDTEGNHLLETDQLLNNDCDATTIEREPISLKFSHTSWLVAYSSFNVFGGQSLGIFAKILDQHCPDCEHQPLLRLDESVPDEMIVVLTSLFSTRFGFMAIWTQCTEDSSAPKSMIGRYRCFRVNNIGTIWARSFRFDGHPLGDALKINDAPFDQRWATGSVNLYPANVTRGNEIYVAWTRLIKDVQRAEVWGQLFEYFLDGTVEVTCNATRLNELEQLTIPLPDVVEIPETGFAVVWGNNGTIMKKTFQNCETELVIADIDQFQTSPIAAVIWAYYPGYSVLWFADKNVYIEFFKSTFTDNQIGEILQVNDLPLEGEFNENFITVSCYFGNVSDYCQEQAFVLLANIHSFPLRGLMCQIISWSSVKGRTLTPGEDIYVQYVHPPPLPTIVKEGLQCNTSDITFGSDVPLYICDGSTSYANCSSLDLFDTPFELETRMSLYGLQDGPLFHQSDGACLVDLSLRNRQFCGTLSSCALDGETKLCSDSLSVDIIYDIQFRWDGTTLLLEVMSDSGPDGEQYMYEQSTPFSTPPKFQVSNSFLCYDGSLASEARFYGFFYYIRANSLKAVLTTVPGTAGKSGQREAYLTAHGVLMAVAWVVFIPIGITSASHFKHRERLWLPLHSALNFFGAIFCIIGFVLGIGFLGNHVFVSHMVIGIIVTFIAVFQPINVLFRPHREERVTMSEKEVVWTLIHRWSGRFGMILAIVNIATGLVIGDVGIELFTLTWAVLAVVATWHFCLEIRKSFHKEVNPAQQIEMVDVDEQDTPSQSPRAVVPELSEGSDFEAQAQLEAEAGSGDARPEPRQSVDVQQQE